MKALKSIKNLSLSLGLLSLAVIFSSVKAQEYDDMYFNKSDRKTVKVEKNIAVSDNNKSSSSSDYKKITESTETYSSKNINPEYIARYKSSESNEIDDKAIQKNTSYSSDDYFVEGYDQNSYVGDTNRNNIDYTALALRDQMSYSNHNRSYSSPSWRFSPYMSMGMGMMGMGYGSPYGRYGYDPFMMGYGSGMSMGMGYGSGFGYPPGMSYNLSMSFGTGYNPWGGWGGYPGYYPYGMRRGYYDPWRRPMYGYNSYGGMYGYSPYYNNYCYGGFSPAIISASGSGISSSDSYSGRKVQYKPRTSRSNSTVRSTQTNSENLRASSSNSKIRVPNRSAAASNVSNGRVSRDYSKVQNEYYTRSGRRSSASQRISTSSSNRNSYTRNSKSSSRFTSINNNKPSRTNSSYTSGNNRSYSSRSSSSGNSSTIRRSSSSGSFSSPSRSSFSSGSSGSRSSSFSSGSSGRSSSGSSSRSSGSSRSGRQ